jgi:hypothetical protein
MFAFVFSALTAATPPQQKQTTSKASAHATRKASPQSQSSTSDSYKNGEPRYACLVPPDAQEESPTLVSDSSINGDHVFLNDRIQPDEVVFWRIPDHKVLIITDITVQNRSPGDLPVDPLAFSDFALTAPSSGQDPFNLTVVGNTSLSEHFQTGLVEAHNGIFANFIRIWNQNNGSAPFIEFTITGVLKDCH